MDIIKNISILFTSIFFESLPFLILGAILSSFIEVFISKEKIAKLIPKNKILGSIVGVIIGFFIPACDCAVIPIAKRLIQKEVPLHVVVSFMLSSPIINPVVLLSTYFAFYKTNPEIFYMRILLGIVISLIIGIIMGILYKNKNVIRNRMDEEECGCNEHCHCHEKTHENKLKSIVKHASYDLFDVVKYLMFGAIIASCIQVLLPRNVLLMFHNNTVLSIVVLMIFAYLISLCSTSDSFVGKSLLATFPSTSILAYLLLGPMIDIKNTFILLGNYKKSFVFTLISLIFIVIFISTLLVVLFL